MPPTNPPPLTRSLTTWEKLPQPTPNDYLENPASMDQIFCQLKKVLLLRKFQAFPPKKHFFPGCINLCEICMKFHILSAIFFKKKWIWLTDWLIIRQGSNNIINLINRHEQCCISLLKWYHTVSQVNPFPKKWPCSFLKISKSKI